MHSACAVVLLACFLCGLSRALLTVNVSPLRLYMLAGSSGRPLLLQHVIGSIPLDNTLWKLINHPTLDFRTAWEQTCDTLSPHPIWSPAFTSRNKRFLTAHCLTSLRYKNSKLARQRAFETRRRPILDLRSFKTFCPFGHEDYFAETIFLESAWDYGPAFPCGQWCSAFRWRTFYPDAIWPLIDIECLEAMESNQNNRIPAINLVTNYNDWSIFTDKPNYMMASLRFLHLSILELELKNRPLLKRAARLVKIAKSKLDLRLAMDDGVISPWVDILLVMVDGKWTYRVLRDMLVPTLNAEVSIKESFNFRAQLYFMAKIWCSANPSEEDRSSVAAHFHKILNVDDCNPVYLSKFLEICTTNSAFIYYRVLVRIALQHYTRDRDDLTFVHHHLWEIFYRQQTHLRRSQELLSLYPIQLRNKMALKNIRYVRQGMIPILWAAIPSLRKDNHRLASWGSYIDYIPDILAQGNWMTLSSEIITSGPNRCPKLNFGLGWQEPSKLDTAFKMPRSREEACQVLQSTLLHALTDIDVHGAPKAYQKCYESKNAIKLCINQFMNLFTAIFGWKCRVPRNLLPSDAEFELQFRQVDKVGLFSNWMTVAEFSDRITA